MKGFGPGNKCYCPLHDFTIKSIHRNRHVFTDVPVNRPDLFIWIPCSEGFNWQIPLVAVISDNPHKLAKVCRLSSATGFDITFNLPAYCIGNQLFNFRIRIRGWQTADIKHQPKPLRINAPDDIQDIFGGDNLIVVILVGDHHAMFGGKVCTLLERLLDPCFDFFARITFGSSASGKHP